jgi:surface protein
MNRFLCTVAAAAANILIPTTLPLMGRTTVALALVVLLAADTATASVLPPQAAVTAGGKMNWWRTWGRVIPASITGWNTTSVTNMANVFEDAKNWTADLNGWDLHAATDMHETFSGASGFNGDVSKWNTGAVTSMQSTFSTATTFNGNVSAWPMGSVTDLDSMFFQARSFNCNLNDWCVLLRPVLSLWRLLSVSFATPLSLSLSLFHSCSSILPPPTHPSLAK